MSALRALLPLAALTFVVALATSRFGLVVHEFAGHGGTAVALGGHLDAVHLYWFGGGWIQYHGDFGTASWVAIAMGGIAVEWAAAAVLAVVAWKRTGLARVVLAGAATGFAIHGGMYLAVGTYYGSGDGTLIHALLGSWRPIVWAPAAAICVAAAWLGVRAVVPELRAHATVRGQLGVIGMALVLGGAAHVVLMRAELAMRADATYVAIMKTDNQRKVDADVAAVAAAHPDLTQEQLDQARKTSEQQHQEPFPFTVVLIAAIGVSGILAAYRSPRADAPTPLAWRSVAGPALVALAGIVLVVLIDAVA